MTADLFEVFVYYLLLRNLGATLEIAFWQGTHVFTLQAFGTGMSFWLSLKFDIHSHMHISHKTVQRLRCNRPQIQPAHNEKQTYNNQLKMYA